MRVKPEVFKVGEKVLYFSPCKYQGYQDKWLRKFTGPFEIIKLLGPVNVVLRKSAKSTPFTTHVDKLRKIVIDQTDPNSESERTQELEGNSMDGTANVDYCRKRIGNVRCLRGLPISSPSSLFCVSGTL